MVEDNFGCIPLEKRLPNTLSCCFHSGAAKAAENVDFKGPLYGSELLKKCEGRLLASTTAACHSSVEEEHINGESNTMQTVAVIFFYIYRPVKNSRAYL